jgi:hypothetical protein
VPDPAPNHETVTDVVTLNKTYQRIKPLVKAGMELPTQGVPLFSCTDLLERDNLSRSHG